MSKDELDIEKRWMQLATVDPEAFHRFYDKYCDRIYHFCLRRTLDHDQAEDLTSETFLRAQRSLGRFRWRGVTFGAYLFRIAQNLVRQRGRRLGQEVALEGGGHGLVAPESSPLAQMVLTEEQRQVRRAVAMLDESTQEILLLHYWEDLTVSQIAAVLGMKETTVKTRLRRARLRMERELIGEDVKADPDRGGTPGRDGRTRRDRK